MTPETRRALVEEVCEWVRTEAGDLCGVTASLYLNSLCGEVERLEKVEAELRERVEISAVQLLKLLERTERLEETNDA